MVERSYTIVSASFNSNTYDKDSGGPLGLRFDHLARSIADRTADDEYPAAQIMPEKDITTSFRTRQISLNLTPGAAKSDVTYVIKVAGRPATTYNLIIHDMVLSGIDGNLQRSVPGESQLTFVHEHTSDTITKS